MDYLYQRNRFVARKLGPAIANAPPAPAPAVQPVATPAPEAQAPTATTTSVIPQPPAAAAVPNAGEEAEHALAPQAAAAE